MGNSIGFHPGQMEERIRGEASVVAIVRGNCIEVERRDVIKDVVTESKRAVSQECARYSNGR